MGNFGTTTSVYMYESDATQSTEYRLNQRMNVLDSKHSKEERQIYEKIELEHKFIENENKKLKEEIDILKGYIKLPWYKKVIIKLNEIFSKITKK